MYENSRPSGYVHKRTDDDGEYNETSESAWSLEDETGGIHQCVYEDESHTRNIENPKGISLVTESCEEAREITDATCDVSIEFHKERMRMGACGSNPHRSDAYEKGLMENRMNEFGQSTIRDHLEEQRAVVDDEFQHESHGEHVAHPTPSAPPDVDNVTLLDQNVVHDQSERNACERLNKDTMDLQDRECQCKAHPGDTKSSEFRTIMTHNPPLNPDNKPDKYMCTDRWANGQSRQNSYERLNKDTMEPQDKECQCNAHPGRTKSSEFRTHSPLPDLDNVIDKHMCTDRGTNDQSMRNSYERLNKDTMEPRDKVCQCKTHPGRAKSREFRTIKGKQQEIPPETYLQTSPTHPCIEAICQRTAQIVLQQLRCNFEPYGNEMVLISKNTKHDDAKVALDTTVSGHAQPS